MIKVLLALVMLAVFAVTNAMPIPRTPPMGWSSWNAFYCNVNEPSIRQNAELLVSLGLRDVGYNQLNIDDCWNNQTRGSDGRLRAADKFPSGMKQFAADMHKLKFKFKSAIDTCDHPIISSVEYCGPEYPGGDDPVTGCGSWITGLANLWRTSSDLQPHWDSVVASAAANDRMASVQRVGHYNDPDMLQVGNFLFQQNMNKVEMRTHFALWSIMTAPLILGKNLDDFDDKQMTQQEFLDIVANEEVIAVNQDSRVVPGRNVTSLATSLALAAPTTPDSQLDLLEGGAASGRMHLAAAGQARGEVWAKTLADGSVAALLINSGSDFSLYSSPDDAGSGNGNITVTATWEQLGLRSGAKAMVRDLWAKRNLDGKYDSKISVSLAHHDCAMFKVSPGTVVTV